MNFIQSYNLNLDNEGWVLLSDLITALNLIEIDADECLIIEMLEKSTKKRFQISGGRIRAIYGHSIENKILKFEEEPPEFLYHGTIQDNLESIKDKGLLPMKRQYVHLSIDSETAKIVACRKKGKSIVLKIKAKEAHFNFIYFYREENGIWVLDPIPSKYLMF